MTIDKPILTPGEVAALFGVDPKSVIRWANDGKIACFRTPGNQRRFRREDVEKLLQAGSR